MRNDSQLPRRRTERIPVTARLPVQIETEGQKLGALSRMVDFSELGIRIDTDSALALGQMIEVKFGQEAQRGTPCRVVWKGEAGSKEAGQAGLEFSRPAPDN